MSSFLNLAISSLDTPKSLIPFFVKDAFDVGGRTIMANNQSGKHEARERFIEEAGTSLFWIGGIPIVKGAINQLAKKKIDTQVHFKRINSEGIQSYYADELVKKSILNGKEVVQKSFSKEELNGIVLNGARNQEIKMKIAKAGFMPNVSKGAYKNFHVGSTIFAIGLNLFMLMTALPFFNQWLSRKIITKEAKENNQNQQKDLLIKETQELKSTNKNDKVSFGSLKDLVDFKSLLNFTKMAENSQINVTSSMLLLDYGISGSRVTFVPRDNNERIEYIIKEGGIILFFYYAADWIKKGFEMLAKKVFKTPIDLDYRIINDKDFLSKLKFAQDKNQLFSFAGENVDELKVIKFIDNELSQTSGIKDKNKVFKNFTLQMAQKEGLLDVEYDTTLNKWIRHSKKYIETEKLVDLNTNLKTFWANLSAQKEAVEKVISKTKTAKTISVLGNIGICCAALSYGLPKIQYMIREHRTKTNQAPGIKLYQEMAQQEFS